MTFAVDPFHAVLDLIALAPKLKNPGAELCDSQREDPRKGNPAAVFAEQFEDAALLCAVLRT